MSTERETAKYEGKTVVLTEEEAKELHAAFVPQRRPLAIDIQGKCPRCQDFIHHVLHLREFAPDTESSAGPPATSGSATVAERKLLLETPSDEPVVPHERATPPKPSYTFALNCNCAETHPSTGKEKVSGCGAWFNVVVDRDGALRPGSSDLSQYEVENA